MRTTNDLILPARPRGGDELRPDQDRLPQPLRPVAEYNQLLRIEPPPGKNAVYAGRTAAPQGTAISYNE